MKYNMIAIIAFWLLSSSCHAADKVQVVTSFSILQDITQNIAGERADISTIVPVNTDAHSYNLTPKNMVSIEKADLIIISGLGFEGFLERYLTSTKYAQKVIIASDGVQLLSSEEGVKDDHQQELTKEEDKHHHSGKDPHVWQNPQNGIIYIQNIKAALCKKDPDGCDYYTQNAAEYIAQIQQLDSKYKEIFTAIPAENRAMITTHDAFNYMATHYNIKVYSPLGLDNNSEATAQNYLTIKKLLSTGKVTAVFLENIANNRLIENIEESTGLKNTSTPVLYSDALSKDLCADSYLKLLDYNLSTISTSMHH